MSRPQEKGQDLTNRRPPRLIGQIALYVVPLLLIIGGFATSKALGSTNATWAGRVNLILIGLISAFVVGELVHNAATFRERRLRKMKPDAIVLRTAGNAPLTRALRRVRELTDSPRLNDTFPMFMTVVASRDGLEFWGRQFVLDRLEVLPWSCIESVKYAHINETFASGKGLEASVQIAGEKVAVPFNVHSIGFRAAVPGFVYRSERELTPVLEKFREWKAMDEETFHETPSP